MLFALFWMKEFRQGKQYSFYACYQKFWNIKLLYMPFKDKLIKEIQKSINVFLENNSNQPASNNEQKQSQGQIQKQKKEINKYSKVFTPKIRNIYQLFLRKMPPTNMHVVNFYNMLAINEEALLSQDFQQSYFRTTFYLMSIKRVQFRPNCLILHLVQSDYSFTPIQYSILRFKSFGDQKFYTLACQMEEIINKFKTIQNHAGKQQPKEENNDKFDNYVHSLGNRMFVLKTSNKFALSRSFLELLQYSPEEYSIQVVKYRSSLYEGCTTKNYFQIMTKTLENIKNLIDLLFDKISLKTFLDTSIIRVEDILYTKRNKKIYAMVKAGMPNPFTTIYQVEQVINVSDQLFNTTYFEGEKRKHLNTLKQQFRNSGVKTVKNLMELPPSYLPENEHLVSNYIQKVAESQETQSSL